MSDSLADRLNKMAQKSSQGAAAEADLAKRQREVNEFISNNAMAEFHRLESLLTARIDRLNPQLGSLPKFQQLAGSSTVQQGNCVASFLFDKPISNMPHNRLLVSIGPHPHNLYFLSEPPAPLRYKLMAAATDTIDGIVWVGDLGELTTAQLTDLVLEALTQYYLENQ